MKGKLFSGYEDFFRRMELRKVSFFLKEAFIFDDFYCQNSGKCHLSVLQDRQRSRRVMRVPDDAKSFQDELLVHLKGKIQKLFNKLKNICVLIYRTLLMD
jgi:hypothetical protein